MHPRTADARVRFLARVAECAAAAGGKEFDLDLEAYIGQYYRNTALDDLKDRAVEDLAGAALAHLRLGQRREPGRPRIRVCNPTADRDGWTSPHTIVQVVNDDMPFLVDSTSMVLNRHGSYIHLTVHPVLQVRRDDHGRLLEVPPPDHAGPAARLESFMHLEIDRVTAPDVLAEISAELERALGDVRAACLDWGAMRARAREICAELETDPPPLDRDIVRESRELLEWMADDHFTFLGYREYELVQGEEADQLRPLPHTALGILRRPPPKDDGECTTLVGREIRRQARSRDLLVITKANSRATVHRNSYLDYVSVKCFDAGGHVTGERRFLGLWTSAAYSRNPREIPLLRDKLRRVLANSGLRPDSHGGKALVHILDTYPRDELFQSSLEELIRISTGIYSLQERQRTKLFVRRDAFRRFFSCLVFVPRDRYNTQVRERIQDILLEAFNGVGIESSVEMSESKLARVHFIVRTPQGTVPRVQVGAVERRIAESVRTWGDHLRDELVERFGEEEGLALLQEYAEVFPAAYVEDVKPREATFDIERLEATKAAPRRLQMSLYRPDGFAADQVRFKLFRVGAPLPLSDVLPMLENMGLKVISERPYRLRGEEEKAGVWIQDFEMRTADGAAISPGKVKDLFQEAFEQVWLQRVENDGFNRLILKAGLSWRQAALLRALCRYLLQTGLPYSQAYMEQVLAEHALVAQMLVELFEGYNNPELPEKRRERVALTVNQAIGHALDEVASLDADRMLNAFRALITATLRTNYFQFEEHGRPKPYLALKFDPRRIPDLPLPRPMFEIFVYSPRVEGVHLRGGLVARGGLRWSDRREDFRTEILGLMKAQAVKNVLIVPVGAKGGFVPKRLPAGDRETVMREVVSCYKTFINGLLDLTDNLADGMLVPPRDVVRHDGDDSYLVVAADKGTATFSDLANGVAEEHGFWLGDAFASGGSMGYDHKKMGITARGGWEAVKRHFREVGIDCQSDAFTAAGIGDMSGDVFGNGMLLSPSMRLVAAFNHQHIFLDPDPDPARAYAERERLFGLPRSSWSDYDPACISAGGGVWSRSEKLIQLSTEARALLDLDQAGVTPDELIRAILRMRVDLLWNGGIGTYVKATTESHAEVGDRANDAVRINGGELRCRVVGEGGNLGCTQLGRVEYALQGGRINTDFIDNSGGVDCSDHEVNIKILISVANRHRALTPARRAKLLAGMTEEVAGLVLRNNYLQTQAISIAEATAAERINEHAWFIRQLEKRAGLNRSLEFLPDEEGIEQRRKTGKGLTRPELAVVTSYAKMALYSEMVQSNVPEDEYLSKELGRYFPGPLQKRYDTYLREHPLAREIIATMITNSLVNRMGSVFAFRMQDETGADIAAVARAFTIAREVFEIRNTWEAIEALDNQVAAKVQYGMLRSSQALLMQATRWLLDRRDELPDIAAAVARLNPGIRELADCFPEVLRGSRLERYEGAVQLYSETGLPAALARRIAALAPLHTALDIVALAENCGVGVRHAADVYCRVGDGLQLDWVADQVENLRVEGLWQSKARGSLRDNLFSLHRTLCANIIRCGASGQDAEAAVAAWMEGAAERTAHFGQILTEMRDAAQIDFATLSVALQEIRRLAQD
ncbi:NAD-glutamate dehydrogenase [Thioalkalivibrio sp. XN8]|uniref:NAD-glutamate dehydrogenase n=1 Tax=Thioalkalivibrio sp. XN8 TaxID=2712863 RepID=UPI0013EB05CE|nr:NAD-glutamate dehydrogenase [Thioalkalivibrio sp. XN8]NGP53974.1 NAD-glutamate dehydrogenase [Thioalkalivibrio sp. XN8]